MSLKTKIAERLKSKFTGVNLSKARIEAICTKIDAKVTTEDEIDAKLDELNEILPFSEIAQVDDYQRAKEAKDKKAKEDANAAEPPKKETETDGANAPPAWANALITQTNALVAEIANLKGEKVITSRKDALAKVLKDAPESYRNKAIRDLERMNFETDELFNEYLAETETSYTEFNQSVLDAGLGKDRPFGSSTGSKATATDEEINSLLEILT